MNTEDKIGKAKDLYTQTFNYCLDKKLDEIEDEIIEKGWRFRVLKEDGKSFMKTDDLDFRRLNFHIEDGIITKAYIG